MGALRAENEALRARVAELEARAAGAAEKNPRAEGSQTRSSAGAGSVSSTSEHGSSNSTSVGGVGGGVGEDVCRGSLGKAGMTAAEIARYSRHLLVPAIGVESQR